jgi:hypothetical protein
MGILDVCYKPASGSTKEMDETRRSCMENYDNTVGLAKLRGGRASS